MVRPTQSHPDMRGRRNCTSEMTNMELVVALDFVGPTLVVHTGPRKPPIKTTLGHHVSELAGSKHIFVKESMFYENKKNTQHTFPY